MKAELPFTTKHPVLLDQRHRLTTLIVRDSRVKHNGVKETLFKLRTRYWIINSWKKLCEEGFALIRCVPSF